MSGVYKLEIQESETALKQLLRQQKSTSGKERIQLLYLLKTQQARTVQAAASLLGRNRVTLQEWMGLYRQGGIEKLDTPGEAGGLMSVTAPRADVLARGIGQILELSSFIRNILLPNIAFHRF